MPKRTPAGWRGKVLISRSLRQTSGWPTGSYLTLGQCQMCKSAISLTDVSCSTSRSSALLHRMQFCSIKTKNKSITEDRGGGKPAANNEVCSTLFRRAVQRRGSLVPLSGTHMAPTHPRLRPDQPAELLLPIEGGVVTLCYCNRRASITALLISLHTVTNWMPAAGPLI